MSASLTSFDGAFQFDAPPPPALEKRFVEDLAAYPVPLAWMLDQPNFGGAFARGASGTTNDRRAGRDLPLISSELDLRAFRIHSRFLADTNPFMIGFMRALVGYHIRKGFGWQACLKGQKKTPYPTSLSPTDPLVMKAQTLLDQWRDGVCWPLLSRKAFKRWRRDGEVFGRFFRGGYRELPQFRFIGPEAVGSPNGDTNTEQSFGIEKNHGDPAGPSVAYHIWDADHGAGVAGDWVDADRIIHIRANVDSEVKRGLPDSFPLHDALDGCRRLLRNMIETAADQAAIAWREGFPTATMEQVRSIIPTRAAETQQVASWFQWPGEPQFPMPGVNRFKPGTVIRTENSRVFEPGPTSTGVPGYIEVEQACLRAACVRWNMPEYMTGKANDVNFAAALTTGAPFQVAIEGCQLEWGAVWEKPVALKVLELARDSGLLTYEEWRKLDVEVTEPTLITADPEKDAQRITGLVAAKLLSPQTAQLQLQLDPQHESENMRAIAEEQAKQQQAMMPQMPPPDEMGGGNPAMLAPPKDSPPSESFGRAGLIKKSILNKNGTRQHVWVSKEDAETFDPPGLFRESGFTGEITTSNGAKRKYVDGKEVAMDNGAKPSVPSDHKKLTTDQAHQALADLGYEVIKQIGGDSGHPDDHGTLLVKTPDGEQAELRPTDVKVAIYGPSVLPLAAKMSAEDLNHAFKQTGRGKLVSAAKMAGGKVTAWKVKDPDGKDVILSDDEVRQAVVEAGFARGAKKQESVLHREAHAPGLTQTTITDKNGVQRHVWVRPEDNSPEPDDSHDAQWHDVPSLRTAADSRAASLLERLASIPAAVFHAAKAKVESVYAKLSERYGKTVARLAVGAGLIGLAIPLPGASAIMAAPVIAVAELHQRLWKAPADDGTPHRGLIREAAEWFIGQIKGTLTNAAKEGHEQGDDSAPLFESAPGPPPRPGLVWNDTTHRWRNPETGEEHEHPHPRDCGRQITHRA